MNKPKSALSGAGFYIVLLLCLAIVGVSGYMILFGGSKTEAPQPSGSQVTAPDIYADLDPQGPSLEVLEPEPLPDDAPVNEPVEMPQIPVDDTPVVAEAPHLVVWPLRGEVVTAFSVDKLAYDETMGDWRTHDGMDIAAEAGTQVVAASAGTVLSVEDDALMGTTVVLEHSGGYQTTYSNLQSKPTVEVGDSVTAGQVLGGVGTTAIAEAAKTSHLHFSVSKDGDAVDPQAFLKD